MLVKSDLQTAASLHKVVAADPQLEKLLASQLKTLPMSTKIAKGLTFANLGEI